MDCAEMELAVSAASQWRDYEIKFRGIPLIPRIPWSLHALRWAWAPSNRHFWRVLPEANLSPDLAFPTFRRFWMSMRRFRTWRAAVLPLAFVATTATASAQGHVTTPKEFFGHNIGDDYFLPNYDQFIAYWHKIDGESDRMQVIEMGKTSEGRPQLAAIITSPENFKLLSKYKDISMKRAKGEGLTDAQARAMAKEGKSVVWFDGGLHATEVLG